MPSIIKKEEFASAETYYPLQGSQYEYLPWDARLEFAITAERTGTAAGKGTAVMNIFSGSDILVQNGDVPMKGSAIVYPDDFLISDVAAAGERISVEVTVADTDGSNKLTILSLIHISEPTRPY